MFRLAKLEISGFKSFADRTTVLFGEGITCVVGPNGCGKSNIAEAISWVLGEQSAKTLRGTKMEDVIFNGTRDRKPTGLAEVTLTMVAIADVTARDAEDQDNQDYGKFDAAVEGAQRASDAALSIIADAEHVISDEPAASSPSEQEGQTLAAGGTDPESAESSPPVPPDDGASHPEKAPHHRKPRPRKKLVVSAGEKINIGRRLYRTGDSDYLMNGRLCLLRDVQDLFAGTGLGGAHYAIIEQGKIGQILSSKPLDRRGLIEEAAGITKFKSRKRLAELKLESARQNLTRVNDITSEVERQVNSLKRQAQKARRYKRLRDEMRSLLKVVYCADYHRLSAAAEASEKELDQARARHTELDALISQRETAHKAASSEARVVEERLASLKEEASSVELEADRIRNRRAFDEQQMNELVSRMDENSRSQDALTGRLSLLDNEIERSASALKTLQGEVATAQSDLIKREGEYQAETARLRDAESTIERLRQRLIVEIGITERLSNNIANLEDSLRKLDLRQTSLDAELERAGARREELSAALAQLSAEIEAEATAMNELASNTAARLAALETIKQETVVIRTELDAIQAERSAADILLLSLQEVDAHHRYFSDAVQQLLGPEQAHRINAIGTLADFVEVDPQYERLIESLFGRELQSVLVPTIDDALAGIEYLKTEGLGRGAFLVVGLHGAQEDPPDYFFDTPPQDAKNEEQQPPETPGSVIPSEPGMLIRADQSEPGDLPAQSVPLSPDQIASYFDPSYLDPTYVNPTYVNHDESTGMRFELEVLQAIDLMGLRPEIKVVVERAFPEKCAACVVPDVEAALHLSMENGWKTYITYEGDQVVNGRLLVSAARAGKEGASLLGLKRQIRELKERCAVLQKHDEELALALVASRARLDLAEAECSELDARLRQAEKTAAARISQADALAKDLERAEQHVRVVEQEREIAAEEHAELDARLALLVQELLAAEGSRNLVQHSLASSQSAFGEMRVCVERFAEQLSEARASAAARAERLRAAQSEMRRLEHEAEELNSRINIIRLELYESQSRIEELRASAAVAESESARLNAESARLGADISSLSEHLGAVRNTADELEALLSTLRLESADAHEHRGRIEVQLTKIQSEAEHLAKSCLTELGQPLSEVIASLDLEPVESIPSDTDPVTESADFIVDPAAAPQPPV